MKKTDKKNILIIYKEENILPLIEEELTGLHSVQKLKITPVLENNISEISLLLSYLKYDCVLNLMFLESGENLSENTYGMKKFCELLPASSVGKSACVINAFSHAEPLRDPKRFEKIFPKNEGLPFAPPVTNLTFGAFLDSENCSYAESVLETITSRRTVSLKTPRPLWFLDKKWAAKILSRVVVQLAAFPELSGNYSAWAAGSPTDTAFYRKAAALSAKLNPARPLAVLKTGEEAAEKPFNPLLARFESTFDISLPSSEDIADRILVSRLLKN
jgi:hypothetical protein